MQTQLAYSYNGLNWYRPWREPFIPSRELGLLGGQCIYGTSILRVLDNKLLIFANGVKCEHSAEAMPTGFDHSDYYGVLLYELRLDGFCSMRTWGRDGVLRTKTIIPKAGDLKLNVRTANHSAIRVQMLDGETAQPIPGYTWEEAEPISGDHLFAQPRWKERADISELIGKPIHIEIQMREAEIFAIRLDCQVFVGHTPTDTL